MVSRSVHCIFEETTLKEECHPLNSTTITSSLGSEYKVLDIAINEQRLRFS